MLIIVACAIGMGIFLHGRRAPVYRPALSSPLTSAADMVTAPPTGTSIERASTTAATQTTQVDSEEWLAIVLGVLSNHVIAASERSIRQLGIELVSKTPVLVSGVTAPSHNRGTYEALLGGATIERPIADGSILWSISLSPIPKAVLIARYRGHPPRSFLSAVEDEWRAVNRAFDSETYTTGLLMLYQTVIAAEQGTAATKSSSAYDADSGDAFLMIKSHRRDPSIWLSVVFPVDDSPEFILTVELSHPESE